VFVFKEIDFRRHWLRLSLGLGMSLAGVFMLILAKA
jgi:hypothetical protein